MCPKSKIGTIALSVLILTLSNLCALADKRVALILGNSAYIHTMKLRNPENDAQDLAETLRKINFEVILRTNVDQVGLNNALEEFERRATGADTAFFFFAGHGLQYNGRNFLLPVNALIEDEVSLRYNTLSVDKVRQALDAAAGVKIMVLDACRNNPLAEKLSRSSGLSRNSETTRGLARLDRAEGMVVAYATQADQVAQDGSGRNSPFSSALVRRLQEPNLEIATLFRRVAQDVFEQTAGRQRPELSISLLQDFFLNLQDDGARRWLQIATNGTEEEIKLFIAEYPTSPYARDAQSRLYVLGTIRQEFQRQENLRREAESKEACAREAGQIDRLSHDGQKDDLLRLKPMLTCASLAVSVDKALATLADRERSCRDESRALRQVHNGDIQALEKFIAGASCASVRQGAEETVAALKAESEKKQAVCVAEAERLRRVRSLELTRQQLRSELVNFQASLACPSLSPRVAEAIGSIDSEEQKKLAMVRARLAAIEAAKGVADAEAAYQRTACRRETERLAAIKSEASGRSALRSALAQLRDHMACAQLRPGVAAAIEAIDAEEQTAVDKVRARLAALDAMNGKIGARNAGPVVNCDAEGQQLAIIRSKPQAKSQLLSELKAFLTQSTCESQRSEAEKTLKTLELSATKSSN